MDLKPSPASLGTPFHRSGRVMAAIDRSEANVCTGSRVGTLPELIADLTGPLEDRVRRGLPESNITAQLGGSMGKVRVTWGVTKGSMAGIVPESWFKWGLGAEGDLASMTSEVDTLAAHETVTTNSRKRPSKCRQAG